MLLAVAAAFSAYEWLRASADPYWNAQQSRRRIEKRLDPSLLQSWATNLLNQYSAQTNFGPVFYVQAPVPTGSEQIWMHRSPQVILRDGESDGERYVCLCWGSGMLGRWGLALGSPRFVLKVGMESGDPPDLAPRLWKPGIYFFQHYH